MEPCKTKTLGSVIQIYYISFIFVLIITNTGRLDLFLTAEAQCASQDCKGETRKPFFTTLFLSQPNTITLFASE